MERPKCLLGLMNMTRPRGVEGSFNTEIICIWESCISISCIHEVLGRAAGCSRTSLRSGLLSLSVMEFGPTYI